MLALPDDVKAYKKTSVFTKETVPKGLLGRHNTKENTWGLIVVESGSLLYSIYDEQSTTVELSPGVRGIIEPQVYHKVELLSEDATFYVEFYAVDASAVSVPKIIDVSNVQTVVSKVSQPSGDNSGDCGTHNPYVPLLLLGTGGLLYALYSYFKKRH